MKELVKFTRMDEVQNKIILEVVAGVLGRLPERGEGVLGCDLHHELYDTAPGLMFMRDCRNACNDLDTFEVIALVHNYEFAKFGEKRTEISSLDMAKMAVYIIGEMVLSKSPTLEARWDDALTADAVADIHNELVTWLNKLPSPMGFKFDHALFFYACKAWSNA